MFSCYHYNICKHDLIVNLNVYIRAMDIGNNIRYMSIMKVKIMLHLFDMHFPDILLAFFFFFFLQESLFIQYSMHLHTVHVCILNVFAHMHTDSYTQVWKHCIITTHIPRIPIQRSLSQIVTHIHISRQPMTNSKNGVNNPSEDIITDMLSSKKPRTPIFTSLSLKKPSFISAALHHLSSNTAIFQQYH